jgi:hypothetical protein
MKTKLEDVLKEKERELKLHKRFLNLKTFCEEKIFPRVDLPLQHHVEMLKDLIERMIPDPKDRTEEMFSGEIFALLGTLYLHDVGFVKDFEWSVNREILDTIEGTGKEIFLNYEIGKRLDIPESAIEIINYLSFSHIVKKIPTEWEIIDKDAKAIIRNTKTFESLFNFAHLLVDVFYPDIRYLSLKRYKSPQIILRPSETAIYIDSKEGIITIKYNARFPYELHVLEGAKKYVENMFTRFKDNAKGRLGFQYKKIIWDITSNFSHDRDIFEIPKFSPYSEFEGPPFERWDEADRILDRLLDYGYVMVVGDAGIGKTTVLKSFIMPQLLTMSPNVFYCEMWSHPTSEIRDVINQRLKFSWHEELDIISLCKKLLEEAPCFFVIDSVEKLTSIDAKEKEKFERFLDFCRGEGNAYIIICGDKESFFQWQPIFHAISNTSFFEVKPIAGDQISVESNDGNAYYKPIEFKLLQASLDPNKMLEELLPGLKDRFEFRSFMAFFIGKHERQTGRHTIEEIFYETALPHETILAYVKILTDKDILKETDSPESTYYSLTNRYFREPIYTVLKLDVFEEREKIRMALKDCMSDGASLDDTALTLIDTWKEHMAFTKEEAGLVLASCIEHQRDYGYFFEKTKKDGKGIDIQPILRLIHIDDVEKRAKAIQLLVDTQDRDMINPLLLHLKKENVLEIKELLVKGIGRTGKKKAIIAIMSALKEPGDKQLRLQSVEFFHSLFGDNSYELLSDIKEIEEDPSIIRRIDQLLSKQGGSA